MASGVAALATKPSPTLQEGFLCWPRCRVATAWRHIAAHFLQLAPKGGRALLGRIEACQPPVMILGGGVSSCAVEMASGMGANVTSRHGRDDASPVAALWRACPLVTADAARSKILHLRGRGDRRCPSRWRTPSISARTVAAMKPGPSSSMFDRQVAAPRFAPTIHSQPTLVDGVVHYAWQHAARCANIDIRARQCDAAVRSGASDKGFPRR
jgi:hypothetical protein